ncbi:uncharacterized protein LOC143284131 [Babylonia areolata]|uniref:uncharacterized protein LOC143284131 n=1 Tax=Babylonia areolata TaxID=304850 RepID=UPI003FD2F568
MAASEGRGGGGKTEQDDFFLESCSVCLEPYVGRDPKILSCFHTFCLPCLTALAAESAAVAAAATTSGLAVVSEAGCGKDELGTEERKPAEDRVDSSAQHEDRGRKNNVEEGDAGNEGDENDSIKEEEREKESVKEEETENESIKEEEREKESVKEEETERESFKEEEREEEAARSKLAQSPSRAAPDVTSGAVFLCPTCRAVVTVPEGGVAVLQTNFYVVAKAEEAAKNKPMPCEMCEDEEGEAGEGQNRKEAAYSCDKCQQRMCRACRRLHDKVVNTMEHQVTALMTTRTASRPRDTPMSKKCKVHQDRELCLHCQDCDVMICLVCKLTSHQPHQTEDVGAAALRGKGELSALVKRAKEQVLVMKKLRSRLSRDVSELDRQRREAGEEARARYSTLLAWASRSRDELLEAIAAERETALAELETEDVTISTIADTLSRLVSRASLVTTTTTTTTTNEDDSSASKMLLLKNELQAALVLAAEEEKHEDLRERSDKRGGGEQRRFMSIRSESSAVDLGAVRAFLGELSAVGTGNTVVGRGRGTGAPFVSLKDEVQALAARVGQWKANTVSWMPSWRKRNPKPIQPWLSRQPVPSGAQPQ